MKIQMANVNETDRYDDGQIGWKTVAEDVYLFIEKLNGEELDINEHWYRIINDKGEIINL